MKINKFSPIPLYLQLVDELMEQIESGYYKTNDKLPSERVLCEQYNVSRTTVRQTIQELQRAGCIRVQHGKGNYVVEPIIKQSLLTIYSFSEEMKKLNKTPSTRMLSFQKIPCESKLAKEMQLETGAMVYKLERVRLADNEPVMMVTTYLPVERLPGLSEEKLTNGSLYGIMFNEYNLCLTSAEERMQAVAARRNEAVHLDITQGDPVMMIKRKSFEQNNVVEYAVAIARGDRFKYEVLLGKSKEGNGQ